VIAAEFFYAAVGFDERELVVGVKSHAVEEGHLVERAGDCPFHAGAVIAPDVEDQRVVEVTQVVDRVEQSPDVPVRVLRKPGEHLHLPHV